MINKNKFAEFVNNHSFKIELGFLFTFIILYFIPISVNFLNFPFTPFIALNDLLHLEYYDNLTNYIIFINSLFATLFLFIIIISVVSFIIKKKFSIYFLLIYICISIAYLIVYEIIPMINLEISILFLFIMIIFRWYQFALKYGYWISPKMKRGNN